jgi:hypothetical protein
MPEVQGYQHTKARDASQPKGVEPGTIGSDI